MSSLFDSIHNPNPKANRNQVQQLFFTTAPPPPPPPPSNNPPTANLILRFNQVQATVDADWTQMVQLITQQNTLSASIQDALKTGTSIDHYLSTGIHESEKVPMISFMHDPSPYDYFRAMQEKRRECLRSAQEGIERYLRLDEAVKDSVVVLGQMEADMRALRGRILVSREREFEVMKGRVEALVRNR